MLLLMTLGVLCNGALSQDLSFTTDIQILSELPLERLIQIKKTFYVDQEDFDEIVSNSTDGVPQALALQSKKDPKERGGYHTYHHLEDHHPSKKGGKTDIQSIFQISVTTLAFLAFGGYLICLLVQAVRGKTNNDMTTATQIMSALVRSQLRRRSTRAPQRVQRPASNGYRRRPRPRPRPKREARSSKASVEAMYHALVEFSEGYTKYHTVDYLRYNSSSYYW
ncbi:hypothetical protein NQ318_009893 [Aromia moschata]|uniref:Uncharacterized protein n=1 Tax=Aromia moschata TaxID=1265417 RepID=A0AAV8Y494_9CUCU|nr:hypothetical protein NQ318_009893 [Aromia moschata]